MRGNVPTMSVKDGDSFRTINLADYDPSVHAPATVEDGQAVGEVMVRVVEGDSFRLVRARDFNPAVDVPFAPEDAALLGVSL